MSDALLILASRAPATPDQHTEHGWLAQYKSQFPPPNAKQPREDYQQWVRRRIAAWEHYVTFDWPVYWATTVANKLLQSAS